MVEFVEMETGSSVYEEQSPFGSRLRERRPQVQLDSLVKQRRPAFASVDMIKLDVQGYELRVLDGARSVLATADVALLEVSLIPINRGCPLLHEVVAYMAARGFQVYDFCSQDP